MNQTTAKPKKTIKYEPVDRRQTDRRGSQSDRRAEPRENSATNDRRQGQDRRRKT